MESGPGRSICSAHTPLNGRIDVMAALATVGSVRSRSSSAYVGAAASSPDTVSASISRLTASTLREKP